MFVTTWAGLGKREMMAPVLIYIILPQQSGASAEFLTHSCVLLLVGEKQNEI